MVENLTKVTSEQTKPAAPAAPTSPPAPKAPAPPPAAAAPQPMPQAQMPPPPNYGYAPPQQQYAQNVAVQPAQFQQLAPGTLSIPEIPNIDLIMDVPLQVTVELGRTKKLIREILEFNPGSVVELDKLAGEPVDILVNGKLIAKGEVVVIDENFGVRITYITNQADRLSTLQ
jgi:flagellar motor switch protein FliN/FliY